MSEHTFDDWDLDQPHRLRVEELAVTRVLEVRGALRLSDNCHGGVRC